MGVFSKQYEPIITVTMFNTWIFASEEAAPPTVLQQVPSFGICKVGGHLHVHGAVKGACGVWGMPWSFLGETADSGEVYTLLWLLKARFVAIHAQFLCRCFPHTLPLDLCVFVCLVVCLFVCYG